MATNIKGINFNQIQAKIETAINTLDSIPVKFRTFEAFMVQKQSLLELKSLLGKSEVFASEAIRDHHWNMILKSLKIQKRIQNVNLEDYLKVRPEQNLDKIREILSKAEGEQVLEQMLQKIIQFWQQEQFQFVNYKDQIELIYGWEDLLGKIDDDLQQLLSMKLSQHFDVFQDEVNSWSEKLALLQNILDLWMNAQKKWVYLQSILTSSVDIQYQLPNEYGKFKSIDSDFKNSQKKAINTKRILETCLQINEPEKTYNSLLDGLEKIQKSLLDYLEK